MKKLFTLLATVTLSVMLFAQAPQTFSYQTVIRDNNWQTIANQNVSIEIAIREDAANGTIIYKEAHSSTTNDLGLVNLAVGGGGVVSGSWANIDWGNHSYFIQVAVDVLAGVNYIVMGTTQLRSVPYALYAENAGSSTPGPQGATGPIGLTGAAGTNGVDGNDGAQGPIGLTGATGAQGPTGLTGATGPTGSQGPIGLTGATGAAGTNGTNGVDGNDGAQGPIGLTGAAGTNGTNGVDGNDGAQGPIGLTGAAGTNGVDGAIGAQGPIGLTGPQGIQGPVGNDGIDGVDGAQGPIGLTGPQGIQGPSGNDGTDGQDGIDGVDGAVGAQGPIGQTGPQGIQGPAGNDGADGQDGIDGIDAVIDYDSLANLISIDSTFTANVGSGIGGGGCDYSFPEGLEGDMIPWDLSNGNDYTVPAGKNLFITNVHTNDGSSFRIDGIRVLDGLWGVYIANNQGTAMLKQPLCVKSGQVVSASPNSSYTETFYGFLTDAVVEPISFWFDNVGSGNDSYTVPVGKKLVITNIWMYGSSNSDLTIDGIIIAAENFNKPEAYSNKYLEIPLIIESGSIISIPNNYSSFNGYLVDENYFANCGGGGGGSSATSSLDSTAIANMIANSGGNMVFGEFEDITSQINNNLTNTAPYPEYQQNEDGFLYIILNPSNQWFQISIDSVSMLPNGPSGGYYYPNSLSNMSLLIPLKKDYYWTFSAYNTTVNKAFWIPLESGGGGSSSTNTGTMSVSTFGDTLTMNGQSIIVPGISYQNYVPTFGSVTDIDGNIYQTTTIYGKEWMIEDLLVTKYSNGDPIPLITGINNWQGSVCNNPGYIINNSFGNLGIKVWYNLPAIIDARGICPNGWHLATEQDYIDVLDLFDSMTSTGNSYGFWWENAGPAFKKQTGGWDVSNYPFGQATNDSYLGFESFDPTSCTNANNFYGYNTDHKSWTGTPGGLNGGNWYLDLSANDDRVSFSDGSGDTMLPCRCVKD
jgi:uncharacterized protein (TIGR02145 family)